MWNSFCLWEFDDRLPRVSQSTMSSFDTPDDWSAYRKQTSRWLQMATPWVWRFRHWSIGSGAQRGTTERDEGTRVIEPRECDRATTHRRE